ncbi:MAG: hypothetical protein ACTSRU_21220 [Candidatus Hodarchaeales archaeon]
MKEELTKLEKVQDFLNEEDNGIIIRTGMVVVGIVLGCLLVLLSAAFQNPTLSVTFLVFGCVSFAGFLIAPAIWWLAEYS